MQTYHYRAWLLEGAEIQEGIEEEILANDEKKARRKAWSRAITNMQPKDGQSVLVDYVRFGNMPELKQQPG